MSALHELHIFLQRQRADECAMKMSRKLAATKNLLSLKQR